MLDRRASDGTDLHIGPRGSTREIRPVGSVCGVGAVKAVPQATVAVEHYAREGRLLVLDNPEQFAPLVRRLRSVLVTRWGEDPLWAAIYSWSVDHERLGGLFWRLGGLDLSRLHGAAAAIGDLPNGSTVLDVPSGSGVALRGLRAGQGVDYVAADLAPTMLDRTLRTARERGVADQVRVLACDVGELPLDDGCVDLVVSLTGLHCFPDPRRAVSEIVRVLRPGGRLTGSAVLNDTGTRFAPIRLVGRAAGLIGPSASTSELRRWLREDGLADIEIEVDGPLGYFTGTKG